MNHSVTQITPLSNFYRCNINIYDRDWFSSDHPYQWMKMVENGFDKEAQEILEAPHAAAAKVIANRIPSEQLKNWGDYKKLGIMRFILRAKVNQCSEFKRALIAGGKKHFCEATRDLFWGCGMDDSRVGSLYQTM